LKRTWHVWQFLIAAERLGFFVSLHQLLQVRLSSFFSFFKLLKLSFWIFYVCYNCSCYVVFLFFWGWLKYEYYLCFIVHVANYPCHVFMYVTIVRVVFFYFFRMMKILILFILHWSCCKPSLSQLELEICLIEICNWVFRPNCKFFIFLTF
jgi:hypothetical protein